MANIMRLGGGAGGGTTVGVSYNADGTQNLAILDKGKIVEVPPVLLWENESPTSDFAAQTVAVDGGYDGYLVECVVNAVIQDTSVVYIPANSTNVVVVAITIGTSGPDGVSRIVNSTSDGSIEFSSACLLNNSGTRYSNACIPTRIWGVKYALPQ